MHVLLLLLLRHLFALVLIVVMILGPQLPLLVAAAPAASASAEQQDAAAQVASTTYHLDCGAHSVTSMCSASNAGAYCNPSTGELTINLAGTCGACKCVKDAVCTRGCVR